MADLNALVLFAKVVEAGSFSEAARRLQLPLSSVSRRVADLENELGVRLLARSTRKLRLTDVGSEILEYARRLAELSEDVGSIISYQSTNVSGLLRLSAPPSISDSVLSPLVGAFQAAHPEVRAQILVTDRLVDPISEGVDLTFRVGSLKDSSLVSRRLLTYRHRLVASPPYLEGRVAPRKPEDLLAHRLLAFSHWERENQWTFVHAGDGTSETVTFKPHLSMNDFAGVAAALLAGAGIGDLPPMVQPELLRTGRLVEVMPEWHFRTIDLSIVHIGGKHIARLVRAFKEFTITTLPAMFPDLPA
jgi:DNA-binding transcriptional LysR family regulator